MLKYRVIIEKDEDGILVAKVPDLLVVLPKEKQKRNL
jgi:predicted RNase H-like HicB family nuclease